MVDFTHVNIIRARGRAFALLLEWAKELEAAQAEKHQSESPATHDSQAEFPCGILGLTDAATDQVAAKAMPAR